MPDLKFLLDADMPRSSAEVLHAFDIDVKYVRDLGMRYAKDSEIIAYAQRTGRVVITRDLDFGSILRYPDHPGAIILRLPFEYTAKELNEVLKDFLSSVDEKIIQKAIIILELGRYRKRPMKVSTK